MTSTRNVTCRKFSARIQTLPPLLHLMRGLAWAYFFAFCALAIRVGRVAAQDVPVRDYVLDAWTAHFYRPRTMHIMDIGLVNEDAAFFATTSGVFHPHAGELTRLLEVADGEMTAFHLCHHRNSIFYEVLARDGGTVTITEYFLLAGSSKQVVEFQDALPATSLACVDQLLLRASPASLQAIHLGTGEVSVLWHSESQQNVISSIAASYAADIFTRAHIYGLVPQNRTILRLQLGSTADGLTVDSESVLTGGDGNDGPIASASTYQPHSVLSVRDAILFVDGCSLRRISDGSVRTVLGSPQECARAVNETALEPVPWATRLVSPSALASEAQATVDGAVLVLTGTEVFRIVQRESECVSHQSEDECVSQQGCGWAEGAEPHERLCLECTKLHEWASSSSQSPAADVCVLEAGPRAGTRYSLSACGCVAPEPEPAPSPEPELEDEGTGVLQAIFAIIVVPAALIVLFLWYRAKRRAGTLRQFYGADSAEFHLFTEEDWN